MLNKTNIEYISLKSSMTNVIKNEVINNTQQKWITTLHLKMQILIDFFSRFWTQAVQFFIFIWQISCLIYVYIYVYRTNLMQLGSMFISNCNNNLHVSDFFCIHPQEHLKTVVTASGV